MGKKGKSQIQSCHGKEVYVVSLDHNGGMKTNHALKLEIIPHKEEISTDDVKQEPASVNEEWNQKEINSEYSATLKECNRR